MFRSDVHQAIIEPYYDGGDSYTGHSKYSCFMQYSHDGELTLSQAWDSARVTIMPHGKGSFERDITSCDISMFDTVLWFATCPDHIRVCISFDGVTVFDQMGSGHSDVQRSPLNLSSVSHIRYDVENTSGRESVINLHYLGVEMGQAPQIPIYSGDWEGCFSDDPKAALFNNEYMDEEMLSNLRKTLKEEPWHNEYEKLKSRAFEMMSVESEPLIARNLTVHYRGSGTGHGIMERMRTLSLVGLVEENIDMMRAACRNALCLSAFPYWGCDAMENVPYAVWHHRSFYETACCGAMAIVLSFCGNVLSWHGRNILYNAIIMKGLPRIEADFMTMEYIYKMNQGLAFMEGYIPALISLCDRYPRFEMKLDLAEKLLFEMLDAAQNADGSTDEGGAYWHYTWSAAFLSLIPLAKKRGKTLREYVGEKLANTAEYGKFLLNQNGKTITVSDCGESSYSTRLCIGMYLLTEDPNWAYYAYAGRGDMDLYSLIYGSSIPNGTPYTPAPFADYQDLGLTSVFSNGIHCILISGKSNVTHCHSDKGSFFLYKNGKAILADRGTLSYELANAEYLHKTEAHNAAAPLFDDGRVMGQIIADGVYAPYSITHNNGAFTWDSDQTQLWDDPDILSNTRRIVSPRPGEYEVTDTFRFTAPHAVSVFYHIPKDAADEVFTEAVSGAAKYAESEDELIWNHVPVQVRTYTSAPASEVVIVTRVKVL